MDSKAGKVGSFQEFCLTLMVALDCDIPAMQRILRRMTIAFP